MARALHLGVSGPGRAGCLCAVRPINSPSARFRDGSVSTARRLGDLGLVLFLLRVLLGTAVYALILVLAAPFPAAAGLMLVFPTLNGLAYVFSERGRVLAMAPSMLWMPIINGTLCGVYLLIFPAAASVVPAPPLAWGLAAGAVALFVFLVRRPWVANGIAPARQLTFVIAATLAGAALVAAAASVHGAGAGAASGWAGAAPSASPVRFAMDTLRHNGAKIVVFALCLGAFLLATRLMPVSDAWRGILAGLPFAPFGGLVSIAGDNALELALRLDIIRQMAVSLWLGPAIAMWFIYAFPRALVRLPPGAAHAIPALFGGWALCGLAVAATALALH